MIELAATESPPSSHFPDAIVILLISLLTFNADTLFVGGGVSKE